MGKNSNFENTLFRNWFYRITFCKSCITTIGEWKELFLKLTIPMIGEAEGGLIIQPPNVLFLEIIISTEGNHES